MSRLISQIQIFDVEARAAALLLSTSLSKRNDRTVSAGLTPVIPATISWYRVWGVCRTAHARRIQSGDSGCRCENCRQPLRTSRLAASIQAAIYPAGAAPVAKIRIMPINATTTPATVVRARIRWVKLRRVLSIMITCLRNYLRRWSPRGNRLEFNFLRCMQAICAPEKHEYAGL